MVTVKAHFDGKVFVPDEPVESLSLRPGTQADVHVNTDAVPQPERVFGSGKGSVLYMAPDFDEPLEDFKDYM